MNRLVIGNQVNLRMERIRVIKDIVMNTRNTQKMININLIQKKNENPVMRKPLNQLSQLKITRL